MALFVQRLRLTRLMVELAREVILTLDSTAAPRRPAQHDALDPGRAAVIKQRGRDRVQLPARRADVVY